MVKAIFFDCFGVLYVPVGEDFYRSHIANYEQVATNLRDLGKMADYGLISQGELAQRVAELAGLDPRLVQQSIAGNYARNQALLNFAQKLRPRYKVGLLSNISAGSLDKYFTQADRTKYFDAVVVSSEVGMVKPYPEIYEHAAKAVGYDTSECLLVDDSQQNCAGARAAGMRAVLYTSFDAAVQDAAKYITNL